MSAPNVSRGVVHNPSDDRPEAKRVAIRELSRDECETLLAKHHVGRLGISFHDRVRVELANYVYSEGWIYARTELGADPTSMRHHPWAAFEMDEIDEIYDRRTVEVLGTIELLTTSVPFGDSSAFENAVRLMRTVVPEVLTSADPIPERVQLLRIHLDELSGREARSGTTVGPCLGPVSNGLHREQ
ncbi:MAG: pyridoxamine 5'-phosphate oxidase family protein [Gemmatimonadaceae bacterium]